jgi:hypothetical protein
MLMCGRVEIPDWDLLPRIVQLVFSRALPVVLLPGPVGDPLALAECLSTLSQMRHEITEDRGKFNLLSLLQASHAFQASDPKDKVYSLLGLAIDRDELGLSVDYTCSAEELYIKTAGRILEKTLDITILYHNLDNKTFKLPSWVPDWSTWRYGTLGVVYDGHYSASGSTTTALRVHTLEDRLELTGCLVDQITQLRSPIGPHYRRSHASDVAGRNRWLKEQEVFIQSLEPYPDGSDMTEVLWKTLIGNLTFSKTAARKDYKTFFDAHIRNNENSPAFEGIWQESSSMPCGANHVTAASLPRQGVIWVRFRRPLR